jgi:hypothetical protein
LLRRQDAADLVLIPAAMVGYTVLAAVVCTTLGEPGLFDLQFYLVPFWSVYATGFGIVASVYFAIRGLRQVTGRGADLDLLGIRLPARSSEFLARLAKALPILLVAGCISGRYPGTGSISSSGLRPASRNTSMQAGGSCWWWCRSSSAWSPADRAKPGSS